MFRFLDYKRLVRFIVKLCTNISLDWFVRLSLMTRLQMERMLFYDLIVELEQPTLNAFYEFRIELDNDEFSICFVMQKQ